MGFFQIATFYLLAALIVEKSKADQGLPLLRGEKDDEMKSVDKRVDNFRVPIEMPFDPKFWPARGRRNKPSNESESKKGNSEPLDESALLNGDGSEGNSFEEESSPENNVKYYDGDFTGHRRRCGNNCSDNLKKMVQTVSDECLRLLQLKNSGFSDWALGSNDKLTFKRGANKKLRYMELPVFTWLHGNSLFWAPDLPYGEKEKKQNVFWVSRGKRSDI